MSGFSHSGENAGVMKTYQTYRSLAGAVKTLLRRSLPPLAMLGLLLAMDSPARAAFISMKASGTITFNNTTDPRFVAGQTFWSLELIYDTASPATDGSALAAADYNQTPAVPIFQFFHFIAGGYDVFLSGAAAFSPVDGGIRVNFTNLSSSQLVAMGIVTSLLPRIADLSTDRIAIRLEDTSKSILTSAALPVSIPLTKLNGTTGITIEVDRNGQDLAIGGKIESLTFTPATSIPGLPAPVLKIAGKKTLKVTKATAKLKGTADGKVTSIAAKLGRKTLGVTGLANWSVKVRGLKRGKNKLTLTATGPGGTSTPVKVTILRK